MAWPSPAILFPHLLLLDHAQSLRANLRLFCAIALFEKNSKSHNHRKCYNIHQILRTAHHLLCSTNHLLCSTNRITALLVGRGKQERRSELEHPSRGELQKRRGGHGAPGEGAAPSPRRRLALQRLPARRPGPAGRCSRDRAHRCKGCRVGEPSTRDGQWFA